MAVPERFKSHVDGIRSFHEAWVRGAEDVFSVWGESEPLLLSRVETGHRFGV